MWISKKRYDGIEDQITRLRKNIITLDVELTAEKNKRIDQDDVQKTAWRLVRSASDRMTGEGRGAEKFLWCMDRLKKVYPALGEDAEDYVRSAYVNFKIERGTP